MLETLDKIMAANLDNGSTDRLDRIAEILWDSPYRRVNAQGLYHLYARKPLSELSRPIVLISSHVDCAEGNGFVHGTFDNVITNAVLLELMTKGLLPENVVISFTGDGGKFKGAKQTQRLLRDRKLIPFCSIVLHVTDQARQEHVDFTIENEWLDHKLCASVLRKMAELDGRWYFVPAELERIPEEFIPLEKIIPRAAAPDETMMYHQKGLPCFSLCLPVYGTSHCDTGAQDRIAESLEKYQKAILYMLRVLIPSHGIAAAKEEENDE